MASKEQLREQAIKLRYQGLSVTEISRQLHHSRQWVYKWICRHDKGCAEWSKSIPTSSHSKVNLTSVSMEELVVKTRLELVACPYKEAGAYAIWHELKDKDISRPSVATINRILKRRGVVKMKTRYHKSGIEYPESPINMQIMDLIGPRYLHGGERFYLLTIISNQTRYAGVYPILSKRGEEITKSVVSFWKEYSLPDFLQLDNELSFKGSNRHPRGLGFLIRTALVQGVTLRFIPVREPWRNGVIERFNQHVEKTLLTQGHRNFKELQIHAAEFMAAHNSTHHYSTLEHQTPLQLLKEIEMFRMPLPAEYEIGNRLTIDSSNNNEIDFIRLVRSDLVIDILGTKVKVKGSLMYTYVEAKLMINDHVLVICQDHKRIQIIEFAMPII